MEPPSHLIAVESSSFEADVQSTAMRVDFVTSEATLFWVTEALASPETNLKSLADLSTFKDVIGDPTEWLRAEVKGQEGQALRAWIEYHFDHEREIYIRVSFTNKTLKYCRIQCKWVEREDEEYGSCLAGEKISWVTEEQYRGEGLTPDDTIIVVELSPVKEITIVEGKTPSTQQEGSKASAGG